MDAGQELKRLRAELADEVLARRTAELAAAGRELERVREAATAEVKHANECARANGLMSAELRECLKAMVGAALNAMAADGQPLEWTPDSPLGQAWKHVGAEMTLPPPRQEVTPVADVSAIKAEPREFDFARPSIPAGPTDDVRRLAPGYNEDAVRAAAELAGYVTAGHTNYAYGGLADFMPLALASLYDRATNALEDGAAATPDTVAKLLAESQHCAAYAWALLSLWEHARCRAEKVLELTGDITPARLVDVAQRLEERVTVLVAAAAGKTPAGCVPLTERPNVSRDEFQALCGRAEKAERAEVDGRERLRRAEQLAAARLLDCRQALRAFRAVREWLERLAMYGYVNLTARADEPERFRAAGELYEKARENHEAEYGALEPEEEPGPGRQAGHGG